MPNRSRSPRLLPVACVLLGALAAHAEPPTTTPVEPPLVTICHVTADGSAEPRTIRVHQAAVPAHLKHGDSLGACPS